MEKQIELSVAQGRAFKKLTHLYQSIFELDERKQTLDILVRKGVAINGPGLYITDYRLPRLNTTAAGKCADCGENDALESESLCRVCIVKNNGNPNCPEPKPTVSR